jgi:hypothetical protein
MPTAPPAARLLVGVALRLARETLVTRFRAAVSAGPAMRRTEVRGALSRYAGSRPGQSPTVDSRITSRGGIEVTPGCGRPSIASSRNSAACRPS